ncbi:transforming growth factor beta activator LRRC33 [Heteronotia binoei]|uniref:transforming growth factor beta activator LRRC33 n=1 Tax=Heteronotia binoei TaxID=13085 RepID=UPI002930BB47|nr:transforming growth factor beta activator LRRC33 [Heteronotia binoei]
MALIALSIFLCVAWGSKPTADHSLCKLEKRSADCNGRWLDSVPVDLPVETEELLLDANVIQTLRNASLGQYQFLQSLRLCKNGLELIEPGAFLSSRSLSFLFLANNALFINYSMTAAALWSLPALRNLDLSGNQLTEEMVATLIHQLSSLEFLSLARNAIMRLDDTHFKNLLHLQDLDLQQNYIFEIEIGTFESLHRLQYLNLAYNYMPCIVDFDLVQLHVLNVSNNRIEWFLAAEYDATFELETLDLSYNRLLFFPLLPQLNKLQTLLLTHNQMSFYGKLFNDSESTLHLQPLYGNVTNVTTINLWEEISHRALSFLRFLDMSWNRLQYLPERFFEGMVSLTHLKLSHNCLDALYIHETELLNSLVHLDLSYNQLLGLQMTLDPGVTLPNLRLFNLSSNRLHGLPSNIFNQIAKITTVDLSHNPVEICDLHESIIGGTSPSCIDIRNAGSLRNLYLSGCSLKVLGSHVFRGTSLVQLDLSDNPSALLGGLVSLQNVAPSLQVLSLRNTGLSTASRNVDFAAFQKLKHLDLSENFLASFPESLIGLRLSMLDLRRNCLHSLPQHVVQNQLGKSLRAIYLSQNPYDCCSLEWWDALHSLRAVHIVDMSQVTCNYSSRLISAANLPESIQQSCRWLTADMVLLYLVLALPTCLAFLVAFAIMFLTFRQRILQMVKIRYRTSSPY